MVKAVEVVVVVVLVVVVLVVVIVQSKFIDMFPSLCNQNAVESSYHSDKTENSLKY